METEDPVEDTNTYNQNLLPFLSLFKMLDERIIKVRKEVRSLIKCQKTVILFTANLSTHIEVMFDYFRQTIGKKPNDLPAEFDGSTIWKVIENLIKMVLNVDSDMKKEISTSVSGILADQIALRKQLNIEILERKSETKKIDDVTRDTSTRTDGVEKFTVAGLELLKRQIDVLNSNIKSLKPSKHLIATSKTLESEIKVTDDTSDDFKKLHRMIDDLKTTVQSLKNKSDGNAIQFGGLGFTLGYDAGAWTEVNVGLNGYGWIYDYHILMQDVWSNISGEDLVKRLIKGYKLYVEMVTNWRR